MSATLLCSAAHARTHSSTLSTLFRCARSSRACLEPSGDWHSRGSRAPACFHAFSHPSLPTPDPHFACADRMDCVAGMSLQDIQRERSRTHRAPTSSCTSWSQVLNCKRSAHFRPGPPQYPSALSACAPQNVPALLAGLYALLSFLAALFCSLFVLVAGSSSGNPELEYHPAVLQAVDGVTGVSTFGVEGRDKQHGINLYICVSPGVPRKQIRVACAQDKPTKLQALSNQALSNLE